MREAARYLEGERDFASFCRAPQGRARTIRSVQRLAVSSGGGRVEVRIRADSFLHQMVRSIVGTLVDVGRGRIEPEGLPSILAARARAAAGDIAPPHGLALVRVTYASRPIRGRSGHSA
jgi:tRNA pseudouridine38-40 synthase